MIENKEQSSKAGDEVPEKEIHSEWYEVPEEISKLASDMARIFDPGDRQGSIRSCFHAGAVEMYRYCNAQSSYPRWVKASERLPTGGLVTFRWRYRTGDVAVGYNSKETLVIMLRDSDMWRDVEWLEEPDPTHTTQ